MIEALRNLPHSYLVGYLGGQSSKVRRDGLEIATVLHPLFDGELLGYVYRGTWMIFDQRLDGNRPTAQGRDVSQVRVFSSNEDFG